MPRAFALAAGAAARRGAVGSSVPPACLAPGAPPPLRSGLARRGCRARLRSRPPLRAPAPPLVGRRAGPFLCRCGVGGRRSGVAVGPWGPPSSPFLPSAARPARSRGWPSPSFGEVRLGCARCSESGPLLLRDARGNYLPGRHRAPHPNLHPLGFPSPSSALAPLGGRGRRRP